MCLEGCEHNFLKCRPFIELDEFFLKGYYGGQWWIQTKMISNVFC
jgi:hypothetical protein